MSEHVKIRGVRPDELAALLGLYRHLIVDDLPPPPAAVLEQRWAELLADPRMHCLVAELDSQPVASCTLAIIPNLTRGARPYGLIENVVTHPAFRRRGLASAVLERALQIAWAHECYKVMLLTGSKQESVLRFYEQAGFQRGVKTGFIARAPDFDG